MKQPLFLSLLLAFSASLPAAILDFSDLTAGGCANLGGSGVNSQGSRFTGNPVDSNLYLCDPVLAPIAQHTSPALVNANQQSILTLAEISGAPFSLEFVSAGTRTNSGHDSTGIDIAGNLAAGGTVTHSIVFHGQDFDTFNLPATFTNLSSVVFTSIGVTTYPEFLINNIGVNSVPEPVTYLLSGLGLIALRFLCRRQR